MADLGLIDEKSLGQQDSSRFERARKIRKQRAVEKVHVNDGVETAIAKRKLIEVGQHRPYR